MTLFVNGAITMAYWVAGLFFFRFWKQSHDRLFLMFGVAFWILGVQRLLLVLPSWQTPPVWLHGVRLGAFLLILIAIVDKNRKTA